MGTAKYLTLHYTDAKKNVFTYTTDKVKVKVTLGQTTKSQMGNRGLALLFP